MLLLFPMLSCSTQKQMTSELVIESNPDFDLDGIPDDKDVCPDKAGSPFNLGCPVDREITSGINSALSTDLDLDGISNDVDECPNRYGSPFNQGCP